MAVYVDIEKTFPNNGFKLAIEFEAKDEVIGLLGSSGCGKSLTLKCIAGIETPDKGRIIINGETVFDSAAGIDIPTQKRGVGFLFQNYALFPTMTLFDNIACVSKGSKGSRYELAEDFIKRFRLDDVKSLYPSQISGGQQQRTALARMLASQPRILMLDEPFSALDTQLKLQMEGELEAVLDGFEGTTIFVSHNDDEVKRFCGRVIDMSKILENS